MEQCGALRQRCDEHVLALGVGAVSYGAESVEGRAASRCGKLPSDAPPTLTPLGSGRPNDPAADRASLNSPRLTLVGIDGRCMPL